MRLADAVSVTLGPKGRNVVRAAGCIIESHVLIFWDEVSLVHQPGVARSCFGSTNKNRIMRSKVTDVFRIVFPMCFTKRV